MSIQRPFSLDDQPLEDGEKFKKIKPKFDLSGKNVRLIIEFDWLSSNFIDNDEIKRFLLRDGWDSLCSILYPIEEKLGIRKN